MATMSPSFTTTATGAGWTASAGLPYSPNETFNVFFGEANTYPGLPTAGAFVVSNTVTSRGTLSRSPSLASAPTYTGQSFSTSATTTFDPPLAATPATSIPHDGWTNQYRNVDTFYDLAAVSFSGETMQITYYLDDPADGAEGAQTMLMIAGGM